MKGKVLVAVALLVLTCVPSFPQVVISTQAGLINFTQDGVRLNDQPVEQRKAQFQQMRQQDVLSTTRGLAEVLLTPGVFLRMGEDSAFRLVSSQITDARVEVLSGAVIVEAAEMDKDSAVTLSHEQAQVSILKRGIYRLDTDPATLRVLDGKALVRYAGREMEVGGGKAIALNDSLAVTKFNAKRGDWFDLWSRDRAAYLAALNRSTAMSLNRQRGYGRLSGWAYNPLYGLYTFIPGRGYYCGWYGACYYSAGDIYRTYEPRSSGYSASSGGGGGGGYSGSGSSLSAGSWSSSSPGAATGSVSHSAPPASSSPPPSRGGERSGP